MNRQIFCTFCSYNLFVSGRLFGFVENLLLFLLYFSILIDKSCLMTIIKMYITKKGYERMSKQRKAIRIITYSAAFTALGVLFPMIFHLFGSGAGQMFLPMHLPVLAAGLFVSPVCGLASGILSPLLSCFITSMPTVVKMPFMCIELAVYGVSSGLFMRLFDKHIKSKRLSMYASLLCSLLLGRAVNVLCTFAAVELLGITNPAVSVGAALSSIPAGLLGIAIQLLVLPQLGCIILKLKNKKG